MSSYCWTLSIDGIFLWVILMGTIIIFINWKYTTTIHQIGYMLLVYLFLLIGPTRRVFLPCIFSLNPYTLDICAWLAIPF